MKLLITGAGGFIGRNLIERLKHISNIDIYTISRISIMPESSVTNYCCDILDEHAVYKIFEQQTFDVVIHLAALTAHEDIINNKNLALRTNLRGTENIIGAFNRFCRNAVFYYASSGKVYGRTNEMPITEYAIERPTTILGKGKYITERIIEFYAEDVESNKYTIMRIFNVYGGGQRENFIVPTLLKQLSKGNQLELGNIYDKRDYLYIEDLISAIEALVRNRQRLSHFEIVNIGSGIPISVEDIVKELKRILNRKEIEIGISKQRMRSDETEVEYCNTKKLYELTGWEKKFDLHAGLTETCRQQGLL